MPLLFIGTSPLVALMPPLLVGIPELANTIIQHLSMFVAPAFACHVDANNFRRDFSRGLEQLTFNSRPTTLYLLMFAQNHALYSDIVAECLEEYVHRVSLLFFALTIICDNK